MSESFQQSSSSSQADSAAAKAAKVREMLKDKALPQASFVNFITGLSGQVYIQLGLQPNPVNGNYERDLLSAKYAIDVVAILSEKTQGNLTADERKFIDKVLYDMRLAYLAATKQQ